MDDEMAGLQKGGKFQTPEGLLDRRLPEMAVEARQVDLDEGGVDEGEKAVAGQKLPECPPPGFSAPIREVPEPLGHDLEMPHLELAGQGGGLLDGPVLDVDGEAEASLP